MPWQMLVIVLQLAGGGAMVMIGLRFALQYLVAYNDPGHAERLSKRTGRPVGRSLRPVFLGLAAVAIGAILMATTNMTAEALRPPGVE